MPSTTHEIFGDYIYNDLWTQLSKIKLDEDLAAPLAQNIFSSGSATLRLQDGTERAPDKQYIYLGAHYPSVVIEIAYSQSKKEGGKNLEKLADQYIVQSDGNINLVVGLSIEYRGTRKATLSTWIPMYGRDQEGEYLAAERKLVALVGATLVSWSIRDWPKQKFRNDDGTRVTNRECCIQLKDFVPRSARLNLTQEALEKEVVLSTEKLAAYLDAAELQALCTEPQRGTKEVLPARIRKRTRESTPPELLNSEDEAIFQREEDAEERRVKKQDKGWKAS